VEAVNLAVLGCVLRARRLKKVVNFLMKKVHPRENPGYAFGPDEFVIKYTNLQMRPVA